MSQTITRNLHPFDVQSLRLYTKMYAYDDAAKRVRPFSCRLTLRERPEFRTVKITVYDLINDDDISVRFMDAEKYSDLADERKLRAVFHEMINLSTYAELRSMYELSTGTSFEATL